jgi:hypothetical protein
MSNFLAVATVTATLQSILQPAVYAEVEGATVTMGRPDSVENREAHARVNLYLYQVTPNAGWRNADLPTWDSDGRLVQRPQVALDLNYLLTFYGSEAQLEPQRCLGSVARILHAEPVLTRQKIRHTIDNTPFLNGSMGHHTPPSNLDEQVELVKFTPLPLSLDELSKLWSVFFKTPYALSVAYQATVVLIESGEEPEAALPVFERNVFSVPLRQPIIERVVSRAGPDRPIVEGSAVILRGKGLRGDVTEVRVGGMDPKTPEDASESQIGLTLPDGLRAGVQGVQVIHSLDIGTPAATDTPAAPHRVFESNVAAFVLHPIIKKIEVKNPQGAANGTHSADLIVKLGPQVGKDQRVTLELLFGETVAHLFAAAPLAADTDEITVRITGVAAGTYLVRVRVDGAESPLERDENDQPIAPKVMIP